MGTMNTTANSAPKGAMNASPICDFRRLRGRAGRRVTSGGAMAEAVTSNRRAWSMSVFLPIRYVARRASSPAGARRRPRPGGQPSAHLEALLVAVLDAALLLLDR